MHKNDVSQNLKMFVETRKIYEPSCFTGVFYIYTHTNPRTQTYIGTYLGNIGYEYGYFYAIFLF